jgi:hypothetical protein
MNRVNSSGEMTNIHVIEITSDGNISFDSASDATANDTTTPFAVTAAAALQTGAIGIYGCVLSTGGTNAWTNPTDYVDIYEETDGANNLVSHASYKLTETGTPAPAAANDDTIDAGSARQIFVSFYDDSSSGVTGTAAVTLANATSSATGSVMNPPAVLYVKEVGFVTNTTGGGTSDITVAAGGVPIGDTIVIYGACDNTGSAGAATTISVADNSDNSGTANTYTLQTPQAIADPGAASAGQQGFFVVCPVTRSLDAGDTITITYGNTTTAKAINAQQFTGAHTTTPVLSGSYARQDNQTGQAVSVAATPDMNGQVVCALVAVEGGTADSFTQDTDTTDGAWVTLTRRGSGTTTSGSTLNSTYKYVQNTGTPSAQTYDHSTMLGTARDHCAAILVLDCQPITGTVAVTLAAATSSASGTVTDPGITGTVAVTLEAFTSSASGTEVFTGTSAQTLADFTSSASGTVANPVTGTVAVTLEDFTSSASGTVGDVITGTAAVTLEDFTSSASGSLVITGTSAQTLAAFTSTATGTLIITGSAAVTLADFTCDAFETLAPYATAVAASGRYLEDQFANPWLGNGISIQMWQNYQPGGAVMSTLLSTSETLSVNLWQCIGNAKGAAMNAPEDGSDWDGNLPYIGGDITDPNPDYWVDTIRAHVRAAALAGITVMLNPVDNISWANDFGSETDADCRTLGQAIGAWFADEPNILWSIGNDWQDEQWSALNSKYGSLLRGIREGGATQPVTLWLQYLRSISTDNTDWDGATDRGGYVWEYPDINGTYTYYTTEIEANRAWEADNIPVMFLESHYWQSRFHTVDGISTTTRKAVRKNAIRSICWGGLGGSIVSSDDLSLATGDADTDIGDVVFAHVARTIAHIASLDGWEGLVPDSAAAFVTTNADTEPTFGDVDSPPADGQDADTTDFTTAGVTADGLLAVVYVTATGNTFDLGELTGTVTHYWFDPTSGDTTAPTTGQPSYPGNNDAGDPDWLLVFTGTPEITGTAAVTLANFTSTASGTETITGTSAQTLADVTSSASGSVVFTGTAAVTLADFTSSASGTETITGSAAVTLADATSTATGAETITGSAAVTLADFTSNASGGIGDFITGSTAVTLADATSTATGAVVITGTVAVVLADVTSTATGTVIQNVTGTAAVTLDDFTSSAFETPPTATTARPWREAAIRAWREPTIRPWRSN